MLKEEILIYNKYKLNEEYRNINHEIYLADDLNSMIYVFENNNIKEFNDKNTHKMYELYSKEILIKFLENKFSNMIINSLNIINEDFNNYEIKCLEKAVSLKGDLYFKFLVTLN